jgi:hypothetical protein
MLGENLSFKSRLMSVYTFLVSPWASLYEKIATLELPLFCEYLVLFKKIYPMCQARR